MTPCCRRAAFTLIELLLVLALTGLLVGFGTWGSAAVLRAWQVRRAAHQVFEDLKLAQAEAERGGDQALVNGQLVTRRSFLVFSPAQRSYALHVWHDADRDGVPAVGETRRLWRHDLPSGVAFAVAPGIDRRACSNVAGAPSAAVTFASPGYAPCLDQPCLKFDRQGFSVMGPGAVYLGAGAETRALTATRPGHFTLCRWNGESWE